MNRGESLKTGFRNFQGFASRAEREIKIILTSASYQRARLYFTESLIDLSGKTGEDVTGEQIGNVLSTAFRERQLLMKLNKLGINGFGTVREDQIATLAKAQNLQTPEGNQAAKAWFANAAANFYRILKESEARGIVNQGDRRNFKAMKSAEEFLNM
ncbi:hypothetical protein C4559_03570 [Candidatus Microgenomates bacterium]|nr:MAG: hypothetical protein C4559_03570 [Candidatus Microgenomates bacterium]